VDDATELSQVEHDGAVVVSLHVQPGAARAGVAGRHGDALKVKVTEAPEGGRANVAVRRLLADALGVRPGDVEIVSGSASRRKRVRIRGVAPDRVTAWLQRVAGD
jgi:uncharacterized protein (TIGR00251 family)